MSKKMRKKTHKKKSITTKIKWVASTCCYLWIILGIIGIIKNIPVVEAIAAYGSLTGFIIPYVFSEWTRPATSSGLTKDGRNSSREVLVYLAMGFWLVTNLLVIFIPSSGISLTELAAYTASVLPVFGGYVIGRAYLPSSGQTQFQLNSGSIVTPDFKNEFSAEENPDMLEDPNEI